MVGSTGAKWYVMHHCYQCAFVYNTVVQLPLTFAGTLTRREPIRRDMAISVAELMHAIFAG